MLALAAAAGVALGAGLAFPHLRGLLWVHLRGAAPERYVLPLPGLRIPQLKPGFGAPRRRGPHEGIDLFAPSGTPVLAVADGVVIENRPTSIGGNIVWVLGAGRRLYYYAHLRELSAAARRGRKVLAGESVGTVGNTGNAASTPPHLHFAIYRVTSDLLPLRYEATDPYPILVAHGRTAASPIRVAARNDRPPTADSVPISPAEALSLTPLEVATSAERAADRLARWLATVDPFLGADADGEVRRVEQLYELPGKLRQAAAVLRGEAPEAASLRDLAPAVRATGRQLFARARALELVLDERDRCAQRELHALLGAIESLALALDPQHTGGGERTQLDYFFFAGWPPGIVPAEGGWLVVVAPEIGRGAGRAVDLVAGDGDDARALAQWRARTLGDDAIAVRVGSQTIADHLDSCVALRVDPGAGGPASRLPICIPASHGTQYRVHGQLAYQRPSGTRVLDPDEIVFVNTSCVQHQKVAKKLTWKVAPGGRLIDPGLGDRFVVNDAAVDCHTEDDGIACNGSLAPAVCAGGGDATRIDTEWHQIFTPTEQYPDPLEHRSAALSDPVDAGSEATPVCVELPREDASEETRMWFELFAVDGRQHRTVFASPRETVRAPRQVTYEADSQRIEAELTPLRESGTAAICVTVRGAECRL